MIRALAQQSSRGPLEPITLSDPGPIAEGEVDVDILHCSVCHSDVHLLDGDWGDVKRPLVPGHEIVGRVAGTDRLVGIGWQAGSCGKCLACKTGREHLCTGGKIKTCVGRQGGFATRIRVDERWAFDLPLALDAKDAAPLLCAGLTTYSPLVRLGVREGMCVGVVGLGGLGHLAARFAKAFGAHVIGFDPDTTDKRELADTVIDSRGALPNDAVDVLLVTTGAKLDWDAWMRVIRLEGTLCLVGIPSSHLTIHPDFLIDQQKTVTGSAIGSPDTMRRMLRFAADEGIAPIVEHMPMSQANEAIARVRDGKARMRVVLDGMIDS